VHDRNLRAADAKRIGGLIDTATHRDETSPLGMIYINIGLRYMFQFLAKLIPRSAVFVLLVLTLAAVAGFAAVGHLVARFNANEQARGRKLYALGVADVNAGKSDRAIEEFRGALTCDRGNSQYQLSLARALRDTGRLDEAESYLQSLWQHAPEDATINLALARVAARRGSLDDTIRYYHNAMYGVWNSDPDVNRRNARIELIELLLQKNARAQAQSELVALAASLPPEPSLHLQAAELLAQAQDYPDALAEYERVLRFDRGNAAALAGAGAVAYRAGRYRTAARYLQGAVNSDPQNANSRNLLASASMVLASDPFARRISDAERNRRIVTAFSKAGERLTSCAQQKGVNLTVVNTSRPPALAVLESSWLANRRDLRRLNTAGEADLPDAIMDLVFQIEQQTAHDCGEPQGADEALLLISRDREAADQ
jgi:tetratricopeptide (TPR) repeat protein